FIIYPKQPITIAILIQLIQIFTQMRKLLLTAVLGTSVLMASATDPIIRKCASNDILQEQLAKDPARAAALQQIENQTAAYIIEQNKNNGNSTQAVVTIPVVF